MITARLNDYRQSPRKVRLVADLIKGKKVEEAKNALSLLAKRASSPILKLLKSATSNAKNLGVDLDNLFVKEIKVDNGAILYRRMPRARGMAYAIKKRTSHVTISLDVKETAKEISKKDKKVKNKKQ